MHSTPTFWSMMNYIYYIETIMAEKFLSSNDGVATVTS